MKARFLFRLALLLIAGLVLPACHHHHRHHVRAVDSPSGTLHAGTESRPADSMPL